MRRCRLADRRAIVAAVGNPGGKPPSSFNEASADPKETIKRRRSRLYLSRRAPLPNFCESGRMPTAMGKMADY
jgi:hypothetical protein